MSKFALLVALSTALCLPRPAPVPNVACGTHAPSAAQHVWRVLDVSGSSASAVPVAISKVKPGVVLFLSAKHVGARLGLLPPKGAVVETPDRSRKLVISRQELHPTMDLCMLYVELAADAVPVELVPLAVEPLALGLSVWAVGHPAPRFELLITRGYASSQSLCSANGNFGMSGGALFDNEGRLAGILSGYDWIRSPKPTKVWKKGTQIEVGGFHQELHLNHQTRFESLAKAAPWLKRLGVLAR